jgi:hypothetical protein
MTFTSGSLDQWGGAEMTEDDLLELPDDAFETFDVTTRDADRLADYHGTGFDAFLRYLSTSQTFDDVFWELAGAVDLSMLEAAGEQLDAGLFVKKGHRIPQRLPEGVKLNWDYVDANSRAMTLDEYVGNGPYDDHPPSPMPEDFDDRDLLLGTPSRVWQNEEE